MKTFVKTVLIVLIVCGFQACSKDDAPPPAPPIPPEPENQAPEISTQIFMAAEDIADNLPIGTVTATDPDGDDLTFSISSNDAALFEISDAGVLSLDDLQSLDFETAQNHTITVVVNDGTTSTEATITINVTDVDDTSFVTTWVTTSSNETVTIPTRANEYTYNYTVDWGDGTTQTGRTGNVTHSYATAGTHTISISGDFPAIHLGVGLFSPTPEIAKSREQIRTVERWGNIEWLTMEQTFTDVNTLDINATDSPDLSQVTSMGLMFMLVDLSGNLNTWDVSNINDMISMFNRSSFNQDISSWDVSNLVSMNQMFQNTPFNQDISSWNVGSVTNMFAMFIDSSFNQDISSWSVSNVTDMQLMFLNTPFNQDISGWNVANVTNCADFSLNTPLTPTNTPNFTNCTQ